MAIQKIKKIIAEFKGMDESEITNDTAFKDLGLDSLDVVDLIMKIEEETGVSIEMNENIKTVGDVAAVINSAKK